GKAAVPVSTEAVIVPVAPTFTVGTAKAPAPLAPGIFTMRPLSAAQATMSGNGVADAEKNSVLSPTLTGAGLVLLQSKINCTSVGAITAVGVNEITKLCAAPAPIFTGVLGLATG